MRVRVFILVLALVAIGLPAWGQSAADLLQKGIYTQETIGDLDGAIKIYRQIIGSASQSRTYAAQAQYRIGLCLFKKGESAEAQKAFEKLELDYPEEKDLVAKAREYLPSGLKLLPVPWEDNELTEFRERLKDNPASPTIFFSIEPVAGATQNSLILIRGYSGSLPVRMSRAEVAWETMRPVSLVFRILGMDEFKLDYHSGLAHIKIGNKEPKTVTLDGPVFDNEEVYFLFRRLPLAVGYKNTIRILAPQGMIVNLSLTVRTVEDILVPAGKFRCYRLELPDINQTFWIATEPSRPLVKFEVGGASAELVSIGKVDWRMPMHYQDASLGISFTAPPGWIAQPQESAVKGETLLVMLDPESKISAVVRVNATKTAPSEIARELRAAADHRVERRSDLLPDYRVLPETMQVRQIGGQQALTCVAEYRQGEQKMVEYLTWVRSENATVLFMASGRAADLEEFHKRLDPIVETVKLK